MPNRISRLWNSLSGRDEYAERIAEEMAFHIEEKTRENIAAGMSETEARREAGAAFGHTGRLREETRDAGIFMLVDGVLGDLKLAVRGLRRKPVVAVTIILSLGLGIGANAAIFSLVDGILRKPHQITSPDRVMAIEESRRGERSNGSPTRIADFAQQVSRFESVSGLYDEGLILTGRGNPERWQVLRTVGDTLKVLQVTPVIGRSFTADEMAGSERVARLWFLAAPL